MLPNLQTKDHQLNKTINDFSKVMINKDLLRVDLHQRNIDISAINIIIIVKRRFILKPSFSSQMRNTLQIILDKLLKHQHLQQLNNAIGGHSFMMSTRSGGQAQIDECGSMWTSTHKNLRFTTFLKFKSKRLKKFIRNFG